jgi:plasmid stabilization system protein ParE
VSGSYHVHIVISAARAIAEAAEWWVANRPKAPEAFAEELERAFQLLASQPSIGAQARNVKLVGVRRVHLQRIHYYLYYRVRANTETVEVLALWHTKRGTSPEFSP